MWLIWATTLARVTGHRGLDAAPTVTVVAMEAVAGFRGGLLAS
jgi:hypothetical protein